MSSKTSFEWRDHRGVVVGTARIEKPIACVFLSVEDDFYTGHLSNADSIELAVAILEQLAPEKLR